MTTMNAARLYGRGDIRLDAEPVPVPASDESLVRVTAVGLCGSDLHWYTEGGIGDARLSRPLVVGHEFAGVVEEGPLRGQLVAVDPAIPDLVCPSCLRGQHHLCPQVRFAGHGANDGGLREFVAWPSHLLHAVPEGFSAADAALLEPLGVAIHAVDLGHVRLGSSVAVVGCGPIGLLLIEAARSAGATRIIAVEPLAHRRAAAARLGADVVLSPDEADESAFASLVGEGVDVGFEVAGTDAALHTTMLAARPGARVVVVGIPDEDHTTFTASLARRKGLTLLLSRRMNDVYPRAISLVAQGRVDVTSLADIHFALADVSAGFDAAVARSGLKVVIDV